MGYPNNVIYDGHMTQLSYPIPSTEIYGMKDHIGQRSGGSAMPCALRVFHQAVMSSYGSTAMAIGASFYQHLGMQCISLQRLVLSAQNIGAHVFSCSRPTCWEAVGHEGTFARRISLSSQDVSLVDQDDGPPRWSQPHLQDALACQPK